MCGAVSGLDEINLIISQFYMLVYLDFQPVDTQNSKTLWTQINRLNDRKMEKGNVKTKYIVLRN
jgi:hypothetical protein